MGARWENPNPEVNWFIQLRVVRSGVRVFGFGCAGALSLGVPVFGSGCAGL
jgi:hypothetical protein